MGYRVTLLHWPRPWPSCEGISARTLDGLRRAGLEGTAARVPTATPRNAHWNGENNAANGEHLVLREDFDAALLEDVRAAGVNTLPARLRKVRRSGTQALEIELSGGAAPEQLRCGFLVDARGRGSAAPAAADLRGPGTVSLLQLRQTGTDVAGSGVSGFEDGWAWIASPGDGLNFVQLTLDAAATDLPKRAALDRWLEQRLRQIPSTTDLARGSKPVSEVIARGSTSVLRGELVQERQLRIGDAAMAVDPLSGNGIFQALSSALVAPAVINTLLQRPHEQRLAATFYRQRLEQGFLRFARTGRDFYRMEQRWPEADFWRARRDWPDTAPAHTQDPPTLLELAQRPVVSNGFIELRAVAVTSDQPQGVWHVADVELAPLLRELPPGETQRQGAITLRLDRSGIERARREVVEAWLRRYRLL